ncbi:maltokinase N-terminal cap-like domain-containing protein [Streptomyces sanyensis]|uniref:maltokinase N-terminal cap-like domain-containing protein n=1 Tax=Streptomyces sanyensis TaxID=568869 RepID=UPI003D78398A
MSEAASIRTPLALLPSLAPLLHQWLPRQRWFAGKGSAVTGFTLVSATELLPVRGPGPGLLHLLVRVRQADRPRSDEGDCYQLLIGTRRALPPALAPALIGPARQGPLQGLTLYEGTHDPRLAGLLLERLRTPGTLGPLRFERYAGAPGTPVPPGGLAARPLGAEQSNSSLVYGDAYILKVFRRLHPGHNPDLELPLALARAGCGRVPVPVAWYASAEPGPYTLGVLQPFLRGSRDGWVLALEALAAGDPFRSEAAELGRVTAEVHTALADALPVVKLGGAQAEELAAGMAARLEAAARTVPALRPYAPRLRAAFDAVAALGRRGRIWAAQRVHGDLHLGQLLRGPGGGPWSVIDFEGEPTRPLTERCRPQPAVRDVAGMLRSFDYAARTHRPWNPAWARACRDAYCTGYARTAGADPREEPALLRAYETDKAVYEAVYEARHRPDWLPVPMAAVERLAADD